MKLFQYTVLFTKIKGICLNSEQHIYIVAKNTIDAVEKLQAEFADDNYIIKNMSEMRGTVL